MSDRFPIYTENDDGWTDWIQPIRKGYKLRCCDCGLVHNFNFRVRNGRAQFQVQRNNRSTGQVRRHNRITVKTVEASEEFDV